MSDGHRSGRSTGRVSRKSMELKRCSMIEMRWNKYEASLASHVSIIIIIIIMQRLTRHVSVIRMTNRVRLGKSEQRVWMELECSESTIRHY